jgi:hypothetical protein
MARFETEPGAGTTFFLRLPVTEALEPADSLDDHAARGIAQAIVPSFAASPSR